MRFFSTVVISALFALVPVVSAGTLMLDVDQAVELALDNNQVVRLASARVEEATAGKRAGFGPLLPQVSLSGSYTRIGAVQSFQMPTPQYGLYPIPVYDLDGNPIGFTESIPMIVGMDTLDLSLGGQDNFVIRGTAQQTLFTWGKLLNAWRIAGLNLDIEQEALRQALQQVRAQAVSSFYQAVLAEEMVGLIRESRKQLERHSEQVQTLYDNGLATGLDVRRTRVGLTNINSQLARAEGNSEMALARLRSVTGLPGDRQLLLDGDIEYREFSISSDDAVSSALSQRPELEQLRATTRIADLGVRITRTANLPTLFAQFNYDYKNPVGFSRGWGTDWNITAGASMPLFTGGTNYNRLREAQARSRQSQIALKMTEEALTLEVRAVHNTLEQEHRNIELQSENVELAQEALAMAETAYKNGLITNMEYLDTQLAYTQSRVSYLSSLANHRMARAELLRAMGAETNNEDN